MEATHACSQSGALYRALGALPHFDVEKYRLQNWVFICPTFTFVSDEVSISSHAGSFRSDKALHTSVVRQVPSLV